MGEVPFKFLNRSDYEKRLFLEKALSINNKVIAKKNFEIGMLTSERDEALYNLEQAIKEKKECLERLSEALFNP